MDDNLPNPIFRQFLKEQFRFITKLRGKYKDFPHIPTHA